ncbi:hypothetical protein CGCSCA5_v006983 [Colletotrichum siamense]|nr:hypothetical protein CGCSCA5_v006983 [Colletotrichum siamense]
MAPVANLYSAVHAAWTEGRLENVLERQKQLALLHSNVKKSTEQLIAAIVQELQSSEESAAAELELILENIKYHYDVLDFPATLTKEAAVRKSSSNMDNSVPLGPTLIDANPFVPVASTLIPLAAAVAAGSAVLVLALSGLPILNTELRRIISASLDVEAVAITPDDSSDTREQLCAMRFEVAVLQNSSHWNDLRNGLFITNPTIRVHSPATGFPAVFVDRSTGDVEAVAKHLYHAVLCAPRHNPSRVPRLCFVDESKAKDLENYLVRAGPASIRRLEVAKDWQSTPKLCKLLQTVFSSLANKAISYDTFASVIALESSDSITVDSIGAVAQSMAMSDRGILLIPISSMDHGIDILNKLNKAGPSEIVYAFGDGRAGLYVGSFVKTLQVCINEVPAWSLGKIKIVLKTIGRTF